MTISFQYKIITVCLFCSLILHNMQAQYLTVQQAVAITVENNFGILLKQNEIKKLSVNNTAGAAGMLPNLSAGATKTYNVNNTELDFFSGDVRKENGAKSNSTVADATIRWTVFDGLGMFAAKDYLNQLEKAGKADLTAKIEQTIVDVIDKHTEIVLLKKYIATLEENLKLSNARKNIADKKKQIGTGSALSANQSMVDLINDSTTLITQQINYEKAKVDLNQLMALPPDSPVLVDTAITLIKNFAYDTLLQAAQNQNSILQVARYNKMATADYLRMQQALRLPSINLFGGLAFSQSQAEIGVLERSQNMGVNYGASISIPLFDGGSINRQVATSKIDALNAAINVKDKLLDLETQFNQAVTEHKGLLVILQLSQQNVSIAKSNATIALEQYRNGATTDIDFRATQQIAIVAENDLLTAMYKLKVVESKLLQLSGNLY